MSPPTPLTIQHDPWLLLLATCVAWVAFVLGLDLAQRRRGFGGRLALGWTAGGALALGTGIWAAHFVGLLALQLPLIVTFDRWRTFAAWALALGCAGLALSWSVAGPGRAWHRLLRAVVLAAGVTAMVRTGLSGLSLSPAPRWSPAWQAGLGLYAVAGCAIALALFERAPDPRSRTRALGGRLLGATVLAGLLCGFHLLTVLGAGLQDELRTLRLDGLPHEGLAVMVGLAVLLLLTLTLCTSLLDQRMAERQSVLTDSLQATNEELARAMLHDVLTDLPNRLLLEQRLTEGVGRADASGRRLAVLFIDLDGFKPVNDLYGHGAGDQVLRTVARRLKTDLREGDTVARVGGDEFVLLAHDLADADAALALGQRMLRRLQESLRVDERDVRVDAAIGIALYPDHGPAARLLGAADTAMYEAKRGGGGRIVFFAPSMEVDARDQMELLGDLRRALEDPSASGLMLHYQPKVRAIDGTLIGLEALLRWQHPRRGWVSPLQFVNLAERSGLIDRLGDWVIREACAQLATWRALGLVVRVAVNLSVLQLRDVGLPSRVRARLEEHQLPAGQLMFEITESTAMQDVEATLHILDALAALGTELSIDDFGTGYSSLSYLRRLPVRELKIDRSFVRDLDEGDERQRADARAIVEAVVRLAHALGLHVLAEGVETPAQRQVLVQLGCDELQGYLFARPVAGETLTRWAVGEDCPPALRIDPGVAAATGTPPGQGVLATV
ncbi:putative bifunctional diguanylate cyclase/phosphodiesterase [Pseudaquabacterium rugosum]|uniref:EAL domain-containing protein n=1 Tax=Pseudaquabacterium rugosum TaxID=2984194 RepID=A0ABU9BBN8_9BURK